MKAGVVAHDCMSLNNSERCRETEGLGGRQNGNFAVRAEVTLYPLRGAKPFHSLGCSARGNEAFCFPQPLFLHPFLHSFPAVLNASPTWDMRRTDQRKHSEVSISVLMVGLFIFSVSDLVLEGCIFLRMCPFLPGCPFYWYTVVHSSLS